MNNNGPSTTNDNTTTAKTTVEIVIFDDNIFSSQPKPQPQHNSNRNSKNCNKQNNNNKKKNHDAHLCRDILVHENRNQRFLLLTPRVLLSSNHSSSISVTDDHCTCINNNNSEINRNTNTTTSKSKLTARMEEHRLNRWDSSSSSLDLSRRNSSLSSLVSKTTPCSPVTHDIAPRTYSRGLSPATSTTNKLDCMNRRNSRFPVMLFKPSQRQSSDSNRYSPISKAA